MTGKQHIVFLLHFGYRPFEISRGGKIYQMTGLKTGHFCAEKAGFIPPDGVRNVVSSVVSSAVFWGIF